MSNNLKDLVERQQGSNVPDPAVLKALDAQIQAAKSRVDAPRRKTYGGDKFTGVSLAWRMAIELTVGVLIGFGIGYGLDHLTGFTPILMIVFGLFGVAAGMKTAIETARTFSERNAQAQQDAEDVE